MNNKKLPIKQAFQLRLTQLLSVTEQEKVRFLEDSPIEFVCLLLACSDNYWKEGAQLLKDINIGQLRVLNKNSKEDKKQFISSPVAGGLLWHYFECAPSSEQGLKLLKTSYQDALIYHKYLYKSFDLNEDGLIHQYGKEGKSSIIDPFFQCIFAWSNQALIHIGELIGEDITELVLLNELSVYSTEQQLWDEEVFYFRQITVGQVAKHSITSIKNFLPLFGNIIPQAKAELVLIKMQQLDYPVHESIEIVPTASLDISVSEGFLLLLGLINYDMHEAGETLRTYIINQLEAPEDNWLESAIFKLLQSSKPIHRISSFE